MRVQPAIAALSILTFAACHTQRAAPVRGIPPVEAATTSVEAVEWPSAVEAGGIVRARLTAAVSSRLVAPVFAVHVTVGDAVRRGQPLVTLDARELRANVARATATLAAARETSTAAAANLEAGHAALTLARASHDRMRSLHDTRSATAQELDDAVAGLSGASARVAAARAQAAAAAAALDAAAAAAQAAQIGVSYAVLSAPFDGVVSSRSVDPGSLAMPGIELLAVEGGGGYRLEVQVDESRRSQLAVGDAAEARLDVAGGGTTWIATRVAEIANVDPRQHSFIVKLDLPSAIRARSGTFGRARLFGPSRRTLAAPSTALVRRGQLWFAFAVDADSTARLRLVTPGETRGRHVEVLSGVNAGERLVADPPQALQDGARIHPRAPSAAHQDATGGDR